MNDISPKNPRFTALEQPYPDMNADRIEYNLHTGLVFNNLDEDDVNKILNALQYKNGKWYFTDLTNAKKFASLSTYYTKTFWGNPHNAALYTVTSAAIKHAFDQKIISADDMHFGIDEVVIGKLKQSKDPILKQLLAIMYNIDLHFQATDQSNYDVFQPIKMRGIDPLVMDKGTLQRLSALSLDFKNDLKLTQEFVKRGVYIKFVNINDPQILKLVCNANI